MTQRTATHKHYPVFLTVEGRRCVVIGGGTIAERKVEGLLDAGAEVTVVAPESTPRVRALSDAGAIALHERTTRRATSRGRSSPSRRRTTRT